MGYTVKIKTMMDLIRDCYTAADGYSDLCRRIARTDGARDHLTNQDGWATGADSELLTILDEFDGFLRTTASRYYLAGEQLDAVLADYVQREEELQYVYNQLADSLEYDDVADVDLEGDPHDNAEPTDRPDEAETEEN